MSPKTCLITGGNAGIGKQAAIQLAQAGCYVIIGVRNRERGEKALAEIKAKSGSQEVDIQLIDLASQQSIAAAAKDLLQKLDKLDILIHNAADFDLARKQAIKSVDGIETIWATNHIGPILLSNGLMRLLKKSKQGRIITVASKGLIMHPWLKVDLKDPEFENRRFTVPKAYYQSKIAQVMYTYWLAEQLSTTAITVNCIRVTNVRIDISRYPNIPNFLKFLYKFKSRFSLSPEEMAETYAYLATSPELAGTTGKYFSEKNEMVGSSAYSKNKDNIQAVMELSMKYIRD